MSKKLDRCEKNLDGAEVKKVYYKWLVKTNQKTKVLSALFILTNS